jgi:peptide/nickel transport system permease protein
MLPSIPGFVWSENVRRFLRNRNFTIGFVISSIIVAGALVSLVYTPYDPTAMDIRHRLEPPSQGHWLGTDHYGRDVFSRIMQGAVNSIIVGLVAVSIGMSFGVLLGSVAGYSRGIPDEIIMRMSDLLYGFPAVLSAILITSVFGPGIINSMVAIGIFYIPIFARLTRASSLSVWERDYIMAARAAGRSDFSITFRHVLPNITAPLIIQGTVQFAVAILAEAGLSYLGLGTQPPKASWGQMLQEAQTFMGASPGLAIFPGLAIALAVLGFNLLGDGLRDTLDPKMIRVR